MLIVISSPVPLAREAQWINALFEAGLECFHLRKPDREQAEVQALIRGILPHYYDRIACHHHHALARDAEMKRLHFTELMRQKVSDNDLAILKAQGMVLSTSIHSHESYPTLSVQFEYTFIGPVFDSLSKKGYTALPGMLNLGSIQRHTVKRIALGGIDHGNCAAAVAAGFDGIALLGAVWQSPDPAVAFKTIQQVWHTTAPSY